MLYFLSYRDEYAADVRKIAQESWNFTYAKQFYFSNDFIHIPQQDTEDEWYMEKIL